VTKPVAYCHIRDQPVYRRDAFVRGLQAQGYEVRGPSQNMDDGEVLVIWNRYLHWHDMACKFEARGGVVLVAENGYMGNDRRDRKVYAIAREGHNGSGTWPQGDGARWAALGLQLAPWRTAGPMAHVLVCPNRSFGRPDTVMHPMWGEATAQRLRTLTQRPVRLRPHPGNDPPKIPFAKDLEHAWAVVIWSSSVGCDALLAGVPVFACAPYWVAMGASSGSDLKAIDNPTLPDRLPAMQKLAWAQWHLKEIESGEAFQHLLDTPSACDGRV
jgi:hypothetical protein